MSATTPKPTPPRASIRPRPPRRGQVQREGVAVLFGMLALMWLIEAVNSLDSGRLDSDGIYARSAGHLWGIFTAPFIHVSWQHLIANTIPFAFMGLIIAVQGARRLIAVTAIVIVIGGIGTWLISPASSAGRPLVTVGASGVVFGYATYLFARGFFNRSLLELLTGLIVGVVWGSALVSSVVPHSGISWQGHVSGAIAGVAAAYVLRRERPPKAGSESTDPLDRALTA